MSTLEKIEAELAAKCGQCDGAQYDREWVSRFWCQVCGGSGLKRDMRPQGYPITERTNTAPYLLLFQGKIK